MARFNWHDLRYRVEVCEHSVKARALATDAELEAARPGGEDNPATGNEGLVRYFGHLCGFLARREQTDVLREMADAQAAQLLLERPVTVTLAPVAAIDGAPAGPPRVFQVHPKGIEALIDCADRDKWLEVLALRSDVLRRAPPEAVRPSDVELAARLHAEIIHQYATLAWVATYPGPGLPFDPAAAERAEPPAALRSLEPVELLTIAQAFRRLHAGAMPVLEILLAPQGNRRPEEVQRPSWSQFAAMAAMKLHEDPKRVMRDRSLVSLIFQMSLSAPPPPKSQPTRAPAPVAAEA